MIFLSNNLATFKIPRCVVGASPCRVLKAQEAPLWSTFSFPFLKHTNQERTPTWATASTLALPSQISLITVSECPPTAAPWRGVKPFCEEIRSSYSMSEWWFQNNSLHCPTKWHSLHVLSLGGVFSDMGPRISWFMVLMTQRLCCMTLVTRQLWHKAISCKIQDHETPITYLSTSHVYICPSHP